MGQTLNEIARTLRDANKKVQLIYAFNASGKVLKFKVDYNDVRPQFKAIETERDEKKLTAAENRQALQHPERIAEISRYILDNFRRKPHRRFHK